MKQNNLPYVQSIWFNSKQVVGMHEHYHALGCTKENFLGCELDSKGSESSPGVGFCEHGDATLGSYVRNVVII
jgi:hypothetical protein